MERKPWSCILYPEAGPVSNVVQSSSCPASLLLRHPAASHAHIILSFRSSSPRDSHTTTPSVANLYRPLSHSIHAIRFGFIFWLIRPEAVVFFITYQSTVSRLLFSLIFDFLHISSRPHFYSSLPVCLFAISIVLTRPSLYLKVRLQFTVWGLKFH